MLEDVDHHRARPASQCLSSRARRGRFTAPARRGPACGLELFQRSETPGGRGRVQSRHQPVLAVGDGEPDPPINHVPWTTASVPADEPWLGLSPAHLGEGHRDLGADAEEEERTPSVTSARAPGGSGGAVPGADPPPSDPDRAHPGRGGGLAAGRRAAPSPTPPAGGGWRPSAGRPR